MPERSLSPFELIEQIKEKESLIQKEKTASKRQKDKLQELQERVRTLQKQHHIKSNVQKEYQKIDVQTINTILDDQLDLKKKGFAKLSEEDLVIASVAGIFAAIIDIMFVDIPFQAEFDESLLQKLLENIWHSSLKDLVLHLEEKAKVPYDISIHESGLRPDNHRLKSLSHDPLFGLFFSFFDFVFATTTYIDKHGDLSILKNESKSYKPIALYQSVYYFIAHILSDMFTARGIPLPGFFITQIFSEEKFDSQIAQRAEKAYIEGYDLRHLPWMALPNKIQELILKTYQTLEEDMATESIVSQASKELLERERAIRFIKMNLLATSIQSSANLGKYILSFDPKAINLLTWYRFIGQSILYYQVENRDKEIEDIASQRQEINKNWEQLL